MKLHSLAITLAFLTAAPLAAQEFSTRALPAGGLFPGDSRADETGTQAAGAGLLYDQDVTPDAIFGSGNANGGFTVDRQAGIELGLRGKVRYVGGVPANIFNSNGDGTYTFNPGTGGGPAGNSEWAFEWSVNTDFDDTTGYTVGDLTYEIGMDNDPGMGTDYLVFDPISIGTVIPYTTPLGPIPYWDHSMGDNTTANGGGVEATDDVSYAYFLSIHNVAQNSWRPTFFQNTAPYTWDPDVPGHYEYYLAAFDGATEVARTCITIIVVDGMTLSLEADPCQMDQDPYAYGIQVEAELWLRNPDDEPVTGFQAFLEFDDGSMTYEPASSSYSPSPLDVHIQDILTAEVAPGELRLDGNTFGAGAAGDALLATLVFTVYECDSNTIAFDLTQAFDSEASDIGVPYPTALLNPSAIVADITPPVVVCPITELTQAADAGSCYGAYVTFPEPTVTDNCDAYPTLVCDPPNGSFFPVGTTEVTCTATDDCGNESSITLDITVTATNLVDVVVSLTGSQATTRCIRFVPDDCTQAVDLPIVFSGSLPATAVTTIEIPCGLWTKLCAKDEQHTKWGESPLTVVGSKYVASATITLDAGDSDNDGDVDINDVTLYVSQFGDLAADGGCPWDGVTRDTDFNNGGTVDSVDYSFLVANWLTTSDCTCSYPFSIDDSGNGRGRLAKWIRVHDLATSRADLNADGRVDVRDVEMFEKHFGLPDDLSRRMRSR